MPIQSRTNSGEHLQFFYLIFGHDSLENYMRTNFAMMQHHKYSYTDLENMIAWERQIYVLLLNNYIKEENERIRLQQMQRRR